MAISDPDPLPPWVGRHLDRAARLRPRRPARRPTTSPTALARHAGTMTVDVYRAAADELGELPYVELCAIVSTVAAVAHFCRNIGVPVPPLPAPVDGPPTGERPERLARRQFNWVPVAEPADQVAAVVQAYTAVPGEHRNTWRMADCAVHAARRDGAARLVAPARRALARPDGAGGGPPDEAARLLLLSDRPRQHAQLEQHRDRSGTRPDSRRRRPPRRRPRARRRAAPLRRRVRRRRTTRSSPRPGRRSSPRPTRRSWSTPPPSPPTSR